MNAVKQGYVFLVAKQIIVSKQHSQFLLNYEGNDATHKNTYEFILGLENHDLCKIDTNLDAKNFS